MLSVLIPTYNYDTSPLVFEVQNQCRETGIIYEIIVLDDGSTDSEIVEKNKEINNFKNCHFLQNEKNYGRATNMNLLAKKARFDWLLFMDCDTFPKEKNYISRYISQAKQWSESIFFGGICYQNTVPDKEKMLRWKYGRAREEIAVNERKKNPYQTTLTSNLLIQKSIFEKVCFNEKIKEYGYEDFIFIEDLKKNNFAIKHIENCTFHLNYETSEIFLNKTKKAIKTLLLIEKENFNASKTKVQKAFIFLQKTNTVKVFSFIFNFTKKMIYKNLVSKNPSLFLFDLYKLGHYVILKQEKEKNHSTSS